MTVGELLEDDRLLAYPGRCIDELKRTASIEPYMDVVIILMARGEFPSLNPDLRGDFLEEATRQKPTIEGLTQMLEAAIDGSGPEGAFGTPVQSFLFLAVAADFGRQVGEHLDAAAATADLITQVRTLAVTTLIVAINSQFGSNADGWRRCAE